MIKLIIHKANKKRFQGLFQFFLNNECELLLTPEGLKWRNHIADGIVYSTAFAEYPFNYRRKLRQIKKEKGNKIANWFNHWKDIDGTLNSEIPIGS